MADYAVGLQATKLWLGPMPACAGRTSCHTSHMKVRLLATMDDQAATRDAQPFHVAPKSFLRDSNLIYSEHLQHECRGIA